jgi:hypothetical protein
MSVSTTPRYMAPLERQREAYVNPHVHHSRVTSPAPAPAALGVQKSTLGVLRTPPTTSSSSGVAVPSRTFHADSVEARLMSLMQQHHTHGATLWVSRMDALEHQVLRAQFLDAPAEQFLRMVIERSKRYLRNIEEMMTEASSSLVAVDSGVLRTVSASWEAAKGLAARAERLLEVEGSAKNGIVLPSTPNADRRRTTTATPRTRSSCAVASPQPAASPHLSTLQSIQLPHRRMMTSAAALPSNRVHTPTRRDARDALSAQHSPAAERVSEQLPHRPGEVPAQRNSSHAALSARKDLLETIEAIGFGCLVSGELSGDAMAEAKQCFGLLYGTSDGHRRFLKWCDERTFHLSRCQRF